MKKIKKLKKNTMNKKKMKNIKKNIINKKLIFII